MFVGPGVQVNTVKGDSLPTNANHCDVRADLAVEAVLVHTQVARGIAEADEPWGDHGRYRLQLSHAFSPSADARSD
jgi:hypothetical protein